MPRILVALSLLAAGLSASAAAAAPDPGIYDDLVAHCSSARLVDCAAAFETSIKDLGASNLGPRDMDATLGLIAAAALQTAQTKPQTARRMAAILREAAKIAGDPIQARDILIVAELVENGRAKEVLSRIFPASPY